MADWTELSVPCTSSRLLHLNSNELFAASCESTEGIYKYNFITNEWKLCMKYPENDDLQICKQFISSTFTLNSAWNKLFLMKNDSPFTVVKCDTKNYNTQNHQKKEPFCYHNSFGHWGIIYPSIINPNHHTIIPIAYEKYQQITYKESHEVVDNSRNLNEKINKGSGAIIYIPSQNRLLRFGGQCTYKYDSWSVDDIWSCSLDTDNYKWEKVGKLPKHQTGLKLVSTSDERFIIIFGGYAHFKDYYNEGDHDIYDIYVLNLKTMKIGISEIVSPFRSYPRSGCIVTNKTNSTMIINGICRSSMDILIDVINIILLFYTIEYFHISDGYSHF